MILIRKANLLWSRACDKLSNHLHTHRLGNWIRRNQKWLWKLNSARDRLRDNENNLYKIINGRYGNYFEICDIEVDAYYRRKKLYVDELTFDLNPEIAKKIDI